MQGTTRRRRRFGAKRGVSEIVASIFLILIIFVAFAVFTVMFDSFVSYTQQADQKASQLAQNQQTSLSESMQFGSPEVAAGSSNPPTFNVNSIATSTVQTLYTFENKLVYDQGLWWAFFSSGTAIVYQTSADGVTWSSTATLTAATGSTVSYGFSDFLGSGNTLYFVLSTSHAGTNSFTLGKVPLNAAGTIGTVTTATIALGTNYDAGGYNTITGDTSATGYIWVALNVYHSTGTADTYVEVERCTTALACTATDGTAPPTITLATVSTNDLIPMINDLSGGSISVIYANSGGTGQTFALEAFNIQTCTGGTGTGQCQLASGSVTWSTRVTTTSTFYPEHSSSVSIGTTTYFAGTNASGVGTWSFPIGGTAPKTYQISTLVTGATAPVDLFEYGTGNTLGTGNVLGAFFGSGTTVYNSSTTTDTSWPTADTVSTSETALIGLNSLENSTNPGVFWTSGAASPYTIRFAGANTQSYNPTQITPSTVDTSTTKTATSNSGENKLFYDLGYWWDFFSIGTGIDYATSSDGLVWSAATSVTTAAGSTVGSDFSIAISGNTVYWALATADTADTFTYGTGTLLSTGTVTFSTTTITTSTAYTTYGPVSISVDASGNEWVALTTLHGGTVYDIEVYEHPSGSAYNTGWSADIGPTALNGLTVTADALITGLQTSAGAVLVAETSGAAASTTGVISIYSTTVTSAWTTSTWTSAVHPPSDYALSLSSDTIVGSTLAFAGTAASSISQTTGTLNFWTFTVGGTTTSTEQVIESSTAAWQSGIGSDGTMIFIFDANPAISEINYYYSSNLGYSWSSEAVATTYEPSITGLSGTGANTMAITWTSGNIANYNIRFAALSSLTVNNNGGSTVNLVSLFINNPTTNLLITYYESNSTNLFGCWINPGSSMSIALSFTWTTITSYDITIGTATGVVVSVAATSPA